MAPEHGMPTDNCKQVHLTFVTRNEDACSATVSIKAVSQGCTERITEDTTELDVPVAVDGAAPVIHCGFHPDCSSMNKIDSKSVSLLHRKNDGSGLRLGLHSSIT